MMIALKSKKFLPASMLILIFIILHLSSGYGQVNENVEKGEYTQKKQTPAPKSNTIFPQIHTNLNGMVSEFVRSMYQDTKGNYWFGTNGNGIIRYDGQTLETISIEGIHPYMAVREIVEDQAGNVWFGTWQGISLYDGKKFMNATEKEPWVK